MRLNDAPSCLKCGSNQVQEEKQDGIRAWRCLSCGQVVLDGHDAAWNGGTYQSNEVRLFTDGKEICAMIGHDPVQGIAGYGNSVHGALRNLADELVKHGIWIEVTDPNHPFNWTEPPQIIE
jgi:hypothetical protein